MTDSGKINPVHTQRAAFVYMRQSSPSQVENHRESTARQYALVNRACELGWPPAPVTVIDEDPGISGASAANRSGFTRRISEVALGRVGIVLGLEVARLARNNADWYRRLDLCGMTDTLIGDSDGLYHPARFNDRLVRGLKGTMSEAERPIIRARWEGGIRNKAARGELRRGRPLPLRQGVQGEVRWVAPTYTAVHHVLTNPVYAGAYVYGKTKHARYADAAGPLERTCGSPDSALAGRNGHAARCVSAPARAFRNPDRGGHHRSDSPPGAALLRRHHRRHPPSSGA